MTPIWKGFVIVLVIFVLVLCTIISVAFDSKREITRTDYTKYDAYELSWVIADIKQQISALEDELEYVKNIQSEKLDSK